MTIDVSPLVDIEHGLIRADIFHSREIYDQELEHVFGRSWLFLVHDSMIKKSGDFYRTATLGSTFVQHGSFTVVSHPLTAGLSRKVLPV